MRLTALVFAFIGSLGFLSCRTPRGASHSGDGPGVVDGNSGYQDQGDVQRSRNADSAFHL